jgi:glycosyltransferase involved in cell wall biosynthesis/peptidoglycan/xylan/chitin deacetylase (PgdA/CDA1 family)
VADRRVAVDEVSISVVVPVFNLESLVDSTLRSACTQSSPPDEIIVVDDGSTDRTVSVVQELMATQERLVIRLVRQPHLGPGATRNAGIAAASSQWVAFLDGDDLWMPEKLARVRQAIVDHADATMVAHDTIERSVNGTETYLPLHLKYDPARHLLPQLYRGNFLSTSGITVRREALADVGAFDPSLPSSQDYDLWLKLARGGRLVFVPEPLETYIVRAESVSSSILSRHACLSIIAHRHAPYLADAAGTAAAYYLRLRLIAIIQIVTVQRLLKTRQLGPLISILVRACTREAWRALTPIEMPAHSPRLAAAPDVSFTAVPAPLRALLKPRRVIGALHRITPGPGSARDRATIRILTYHHVPAVRFPNVRRQLETIGRRCRFISADELERLLSGAEQPVGRNVLVTFDDGFASQGEVARQILDPLGIKALFFVTTGFVGLEPARARRFVRERLFPDFPDLAPKDMLPVSWSDLRSLAAAGHTVGAHTHSHPRLGALAAGDELESEIVEPAEVLERALGSRVAHFAFPFGGVGDMSRDAAAVASRRFGYCYSGLRGDNLPGPTRHTLLRDAIDPDDPADYVSFVVERGLDRLYRDRVAILRSMFASA